MSNRTITLWQAPERRGAGDVPAGFARPYTVEPGDVFTLANAVEFDNCLAEYKDGYRAGKCFKAANVVMVDVDNTFSDDPARWISPADVAGALAGVLMYQYPSRNNMLPKDGKAPRPKFHTLLPIEPTTDVNVFTGYMKTMISRFPQFHFDEKVKSPAQLNFGVAGAEVTYIDGAKNLTEFLEDTASGPDVAQRPDHEIAQAHGYANPPLARAGGIREGSRNDTLLRTAERLLTRHGDNAETRRLYDEECARCEPPLEPGEIETIYRSAQGFYNNTIRPQPGYIPPEEFGLNRFALPVRDTAALAVLNMGDPKHRKFNIDAARRLLRAFGLTIRVNDMNKHAEIGGLPDAYGGEDAPNLLPTLVGDIADTLLFKRATSQMINDVLAVLASENRYHPVIELINAEPWDGIDRLPEIYRLMGVADDFSKTLVRKWSLQTIAVLYNTTDAPITAQGVLVLQGPQGAGKTEFFRHLAIYEQFFKGGAQLDMSNKDTLISATKVWLCELGEIDSTTKKEQTSLKAFLTEAKDSFREPYARNETIRPRRTAFCGTVNPRSYLRDETGNRRYWTVSVGEIDVDAVFSHDPEWYAQFWRQIHAEYRAAPKSYLLTREELDRVNRNNNAYEADVYGEDEFTTAFHIKAERHTWSWLTAAQIAETLNDKFKSLHIRSEGVGSRLLPRMEKRLGITFERKIVRGRRLVLCPPKSGWDVPVDDNDNDDNDLPM
jgi:hypothetical protein